MADPSDPMIQLAGQVGNLNGTLTQFAKNQEKTNDLLLGLYNAHVKKDDDDHDTIKARVTSLEGSRKVARTLIGASVIGTPAAAAKMGWLGKIVALLGAGT